MQRMQARDFYDRWYLLEAQGMNSISCFNFHIFAGHHCGHARENFDLNTVEKKAGEEYNKQKIKGNKKRDKGRFFYFVPFRRDDRIRTCDLVVPNDARYRAALHPVKFPAQQKYYENITRAKYIILSLSCLLYFSFSAGLLMCF